MLEIKLLGDFRILDQDRHSIELSDRAGHLLALLALPAGKRRRREAVQGLFWPESEPAKAQSNLRFLVHQVRERGGPETAAALCGDRRAIWLDHERVRVDVERFECLAAEGSVQALSEASDIYGGDLLEGAGGLAPDYEEWLLPERERLRELACSVFSQLFAIRLWRGEIAAARHCAQRLLEIDPYCEPMHAALMRLHICQEERAAAMMSYKRLRARLRHDLDIEPCEMVQTLAESLVRRPNHSFPQRFNAAWVLGREDSEVLVSKPLVAVIPFSAGGALRPLSASLVEDMVGDLARFRRLAVLAASTSFVLGRSPDPSRCLRQLGARYRVDGSVEPCGNQIIVAIELVDNASDRLLWARRYRGDLEALPAFQEEIARAIVGAIAVEVEQAELERVRHLEIRNLTAYEFYLRGRDQQRSAAPESHALAFRSFSAALDRDPDFAGAHVNLALGHFLLGGCAPGKPRYDLAVWHAGRAIELDPLDPQGHWCLGLMLQLQREFDAAAHYLDRAVALSPGCAETLAYTALEFAYAGRASPAVAQASEAIRLNPCYPPAFSELLGKSCFINRQYEDALFWLRQSSDRVKTNRAWLAAAAAYAGRHDEATRHASAARRRLRDDLGEKGLRAAGGPIAWLKIPARFRKADDLQHYQEGLALAGLDRESSRFA